MDKKTLFKDNQGQVGIGTLIIFIAMVLVAAIAAAVLINTSGVLQQKAQSTGTEAIGEVSSNLQIVSIVGYRSASDATTFDYVDITVKPAAGAGRIDLGKVIMEVSNGTSRVDGLTYTSNVSSIDWSAEFNITEVRDPDNSFVAGSTPVINSGDLVVIRTNVSSSNANIGLPVRSPYKFVLIPEVGNEVSKAGTTPASYGIDRYITLA